MKWINAILCPIILSFSIDAESAKISAQDLLFFQRSPLKYYIFGSTDLKQWEIVESVNGLNLLGGFIDYEFNPRHYKFFFVDSLSFLDLTYCNGDI